ncbi:MAG: CvpA family protein [Actinomycetota bacterium]|nr:CvpA family protein [Actinomycetota bacterium]
MLDLALGALLVVLAIRGWMRGLVKEIISLAVLVLGTIASFRLSTPLGRVFAAMSGSSPDASRFVAGIVIFVGIAIAAAIVSRVLHLGIRVLPGVPTLNRAGGAALSLIAFALLVTIAVSLATVVPLPQAAAEELQQSAVAEGLTDPDGMPQHILGLLSGDRVVEITLRIRELTGGPSAVATAGQPIVVPATAPSELERLPDAEDAVLELLNEERVDAAVAPVLRSPGLDQIAFDLAVAGYGAGTVDVLSDRALRAALDSAGLLSISRTELAVLAASPEAGHTALANETGSEMVGAGFNKAGITVVRGPVGLLIIEVLAG